MREGHLVAGRWRVVAEASGESTVGRWRAADAGTGEPVELLRLQPPHNNRATQRRAFISGHRALMRFQDSPGVNPTIAVDDDSGFVVRQPLEDATLGAIDGPLAPGVVAAVGVALMPAVVTVGGLTNSALTPDDVGLDASGRPVLALRIRTADRVGAQSTVWVAPEAFKGARPDGAGGLFGLGVMLYRLATGRLPTGPRPAPPSALQPGIPPALDQAILTLLSTDPVERAGGLPHLQQVPGETGDMRKYIGRSRGMDEGKSRDSELVLTKTGSRRSSARQDLPPVAHAVVIPSVELAALTPRQRSSASGWAALPMEAIDALIRAELPLVFEESQSSDLARARARELAEAASLPVKAVAAPGCAMPVVGAALLALAVTIGVVGLILWPLLVVAVLAAIPGVALLVPYIRDRSAFQKVIEANRQREERRQALLSPVWSRLAELRRQLAGLDLPAAADTDLRDALRDVERHVESLARVEEIGAQALQTVDLPQLHARLSALNARVEREPALVAERDRIARTIHDLMEVQARRQAVRQDAARVDTALDEVAALLGQLDDGRSEVDHEALDRLTKTTRQVRKAVSDAPIPPRRREAQ